MSNGCGRKAYGPTYSVMTELVNLSVVEWTSKAQWEIFTDIMYSTGRKSELQGSLLDELAGCKPQNYMTEMSLESITVAIEVSKFYCLIQVAAVVESIAVLSISYNSIHKVQ